MEKSEKPIISENDRIKEDEDDYMMNPIKFTQDFHLQVIPLLQRMSIYL